MSRKSNKKGQITANQITRLTETALLSRKALLDKLIDSRRDYNADAGYPDDITIDDLKITYDRVGLGYRVVTVWPEESWAKDPTVFETEDADKTAFETAWDEILKRLNLWHFLLRVDSMSGIGRFGIIFLGFDDGADMDQPMKGIDTNGKPTGDGNKAELLFVRVFDESAVTIVSREESTNSPRFGQPTMYSVVFSDPTTGSSIVKSAEKSITLRIHWSRIIHVADNRHGSEIFGVPRMQHCFNRVLDSKKILAGAGEMFWKGGFPGLSFEIMPGIGDAELDKASLRTALEDYSNGTQRFLSLVGVTAKSLAPQVADPSTHYNTIITDVCITIGVPKRIFMGSEEAKLAASQDKKTWNTRLGSRQDKYITPMLLRPVVDRLIVVGVLPKPVSYEVKWPDLNLVNDGDRAKNGLVTTQSLSQFVGGGVDQIMTPADYYKFILGLSPEKIAVIAKSLENYHSTIDTDEDELEESIDDAAEEDGRSTDGA